MPQAHASKLKMALLVAGAALAGGAFAQGHNHGATPSSESRSGIERRESRPPEEARSFSAEVQAIDRVAGKITLDHEAISVLSVPARTAEYAVKDASILDRVQPGDHVRFAAVLQGRDLVITKIQASPHSH